MKFRWRCVGSVIVAMMGLGAGAGFGQSPALATNANEILVVASRTVHSIADVPASVDVIPGSEVSENHAISVDEMFRTMVGVDLQGGGAAGAATRVSMRGLTTGYQTKRVLVLVDGIRLNDEYQGIVEFGQLAADAIECVEVLRGPASALFGSSAMGGVISIVTRRGTPELLNEIGMKAGSFDTFHAQASQGWKVGDVDYFVSGSHVQTDGYTKNSDGTKRDWNAQNFLGNVGWTIGEGKELRAFLGGYQGEGTDESSDREDRRDYQSMRYTSAWIGNKDEELQVQAHRKGEEHVYDWKYPGKGIYEQETLGADAQQSLWLGQRNRVTVGGELRRESADVIEVLNSLKGHNSVAALFVQDEVILHEALLFTAGIRDDYNADYGSEMSPHLGLVWKPLRETQIFTSVNRAHRAPGLSDRFVKVEYNGALFEGNPDLDPEELTAYELGVRHHVGERLRVEVALFQNDLNDSFDHMLDPDGVFRVQNVNEERSRGVESGLRYQWTQAISTFANYTFTDGTYEEFPASPEVVGNQLAYLARDKGALGVDYRCARGLSSLLSARYVGARHGDAQNTQANKMPSYWTFDWRARYPVWDQVSLTLTVDNILDETYQDFPHLDQPGRTVLGGLDVVF